MNDSVWEKSTEGNLRARMDPWFMTLMDDLRIAQYVPNQIPHSSLTDSAPPSPASFAGAPPSLVATDDSGIDDIPLINPEVVECSGPKHQDGPSARADEEKNSPPDSDKNSDVYKWWMSKRQQELYLQVRA